ncbi:ParB N-terminal domain-containing protein [Ochrobactrum sp. MR28]|nr:ParB N-terminal domain-containing protein [Ochrobactrum sp. MR28]MBX8818850.1 ParB N-terminal domain-containing protein [Ochrobactrum sp. MR31]
MSDTINMQIGPKPQADWISVDLIDIDHNYQRDIDERRVRKLLRDFHWSKFGSVILVAKEDGRYNCTDGQHRLEAARQHPLISSVPAVINPVADTQSEAISFLAINRDRKAVSTVEQYWAGLQAGDPEFTRLKAILDATGCEVAQAAGIVKPHITNSVSTLIRAIKSYGDDAVKQAIMIIRKAWPNDNKALKGATIVSLSRLIRNNSALDHDRMATLLNRKTQTDITGHAESIRKISGGTAETAITKTIVEIYNKGLSINLIEIGVGK